MSGSPSVQLGTLAHQIIQEHHIRPTMALRLAELQIAREAYQQSDRDQSLLSAWFTCYDRLFSVESRMAIAAGRL